MDLTDKRIIVTGGSTGIGLATARSLARLGAKVAVLDIDVAQGQAAADGISAEGGAATFMAADVADEVAVGRAMDDGAAWLGGLDGVVHCAGIMRGQQLAIEDVDRSLWSSVINVNLFGSFFVAKNAVRLLRPQRQGVLILLSSGAGVTGGSGSYAYGASKGGVHGLALTLDAHLSSVGIRVHEVCPGNIETPLRQESIREGIHNGATSATYSGAVVGTPERVASVLAFLMTDEAAYMPLVLTVAKRVS